MKTVLMNGVKFQAPDDFPMEIIEHQNKVFGERDQAALAAIPALKRLAEVMRHRSGQPYKVRTILYSVWNGKPADLSDILCLDWEIRKDLCQVLLAFGHESQTVKFFYKAVEDALREAGQFDWFVEEYENVQKLKEFVEAKERAELFTRKASQ